MYSITNHFPPLLVFGETLKKEKKKCFLLLFRTFFLLRYPLKIRVSSTLFSGLWNPGYLCHHGIYAFFMPRKGNWDFGPHYVITLASTLNYLLTDILTFNRKILPNFSDFKSPYFCNGPISYLNVYIINLVLTRINLSSLY